MEIIKLTKAHTFDYYTEIARIHSTEIHHGVLPLLGQRFLSRLYLEIAIAPKAGIWAAIESGKVIGFLAGSASVKQTYRSVIWGAWPILSTLGIRATLSPTMLRKIWQVLLYPRRETSTRTHAIQECPQVEAEILAIAVDPTIQRQGIGRKLVQAFETQLADWSIKGFYRVATNVVEINSNAFYREAGFHRCHQTRHNDLILQVYLKEVVVK